MYFGCFLAFCLGFRLRILSRGHALLHSVEDPWAELWIEAENNGSHFCDVYSLSVLYIFTACRGPMMALWVAGHKQTCVCLHQATPNPSHLGLENCKITFFLDLEGRRLNRPPQSFQSGLSEEGGRWTWSETSCESSITFEQIAFLWLK